MTDDTMHTPAPGFRAQLEDQVVRDWRRETRRVALRRERQRRWLRAAAIIVASIGLGTASGFASAQVRDVARRDSLLEAARADLELLAMRLELSKARLQEVKKLFQVGAAGSDALAAAQIELREMQSRVARAEVNIAEIRSTSQPPRDELTAPVVSDRDFVRQRLQLDLETAQERLSNTERSLADIQRRIAVGVIGESARAEAELEVARARADLAVLIERQALRREFVEKGTSAELLARRLETAQIRHELEVVETQLSAAQARLARMEKLRAAGTASELEVMRAQVEVQELRLEFRQLEARRAAMSAVRREQ